MLKINRGLGLYFRTATFLVVVLILLAAPTLSACKDSTDNESTDVGENSSERLPVIFIPGITGSTLIATANNSYALWPPVGYNIPNIRNDFYRLSLNPETKHEAIYAGDIIRDYDGEPVYSLFVDSLTKDGYVEYQVNNDPLRRTNRPFTTQKPKPSLFVFAYDWRLAVEDNAGILSKYVEIVNKYYPDKKVNIVTHSMGGLVARRYIIDHPDKVNKLITIAAPFLGAAKPLFQMIYGKLSAPNAYGWSAGKQAVVDVLAGGTPLGEGPISGMLNYFPGLHELVSSKSYFDLGGPPYTIVEPGTNVGYILGFNPPKVLSFEEFMGPKGKVDQLFPKPALVGSSNKTPAQTNRDFHAYGANGNNQDDWSRDIAGVKYYHIIGVEETGDTPLSLREVMPGGPNIQIRDYAINDIGPGDGTVPLLSAARIGNNRNLNAPNAKLFVYVGGNIDLGNYTAILHNDATSVTRKNYGETMLEHTGIMKNSDVLGRVLELLREEEKPVVTALPPATNTTTPKAVPAGKWVLAEAKLPTYDPKPQLVNNSLGTFEMTRVISESEISWLTRTLDKQGREVGTSKITLKVDKPPAELPRAQKVEWRATWEITTTGTPSYTSSFVELRHGEFQGKLEPISLKDNPKGSMTFVWDVPGSAASSNLDQFEISAKLSILGGRDTVVWVYRLKKD